MTKFDDFKTWLEQGGAQGEAGRNSRAYAIRTLERNLEALGLPWRTLEEAWQADGFAALRERLRQMRQDARTGGQDYRILMPNSENPHNRLSNWISWLGQYGRFLAGDPPRAAKDADRIRQYVLERYIEPAREEGRDHVEVLVSDVNEALGLGQAWPNICQALAGRIFREMAEVPEPERIGADRSSATRFRFDLSGRSISRAALEEMRERFLALCPDFRSFVEPGTGWAHGEKAYKVAAMHRVRAALEEGGADEELGRKAFEILKTAARNGPLVRWQTEDSIANEAATLLPEFHAAIGRLVRSEASTLKAFSTAYDALLELREKGAAALTYGERINIISAALAMVRPTEMAPFKITRINDVWVALTGEKLFVEAKADMVRDYQRLATGFGEIFEIMRDEWRWDPQDWLDIQGFLWILTDNSITTPAEAESAGGSTEKPEPRMSASSVNLILHGPPGTGKTYRAAAEAVRLCREHVPDDRSELMAAYGNLVAAGRIEFVTFHQSMSYEEFVEGLRPDTAGADGTEADMETTGSTGFRLKIEDGIFKRICHRARLDRGEGSENTRLDRTRPIFKVALGRRNQEETQIRDALDAGEIRHGWGGKIDWSDVRFEEWSEIKSELKRQAGREISGYAGELVCTYSFRVDMQIGDYVVISDGRDRFRAFGKITSDYYFQANADRHPHRRKVEWIWRDDEGTERARFYPNAFRQHTVYKLNGALIDWDALEEILLGVNNSKPGDGARPYVLIIDEINRANISKVFGELITLLEPDKRLGADNEIMLTLPYSKRPFGVPSNLHIIGTMNTADRSIALLDTALRRRFIFREMMPDPSVLEDAARACGIDLPKLLSTINERIEYLYDREHQIGHAYFTACRSRDDVDAVMRNKVIPLLAEYFYEDWSKVAAVLGDLESHDGPISGGFLMRTVLKAPPGIDDGDASLRFRWQVRTEDEGFDYSKLSGT